MFSFTRNTWKLVDCIVICKKANRFGLRLKTVRKADLW